MVTATALLLAGRWLFGFHGRKANAEEREHDSAKSGMPFPEIPCTICNKPVDLTVDLFADEHGKSIHEDCYVKHLAFPRQSPSNKTAA
jgi:hypothetical protein